jgi:hypothetical protein
MHRMPVTLSSGRPGHSQYSVASLLECAPADLVVNRNFLCAELLDSVDNEGNIIIINPIHGPS